MQLKRRILLVCMILVIVVVFLGLIHHVIASRRGRVFIRSIGIHSFRDLDNQRSFLEADVERVFADDTSDNPSNRSQFETKQDWRKCRMETCFDFDRCKNGFKIYLYPRQVAVSAPYAKILSVIEKSVYLTANPQEACVFIPSIDTLDQDVLSKDYVPEVERKLSSQPYWNGGRNHLLFNQYSGTWPDYSEELKFIQQAMLVKSSMSIDWIRYGFDVSMPLFPKDHPQSGGQSGNLNHASNSIPSTRHYLMAFKGKRYLNGVGSDTRNVLYYINNFDDIVLLTTCKHGRGWEKIADERCWVDNEDYDKYDYQELLYNSTFCLTPRGRRLGSFRFLESLQATCIPVLLSNHYELPFSEVIEWNKVVVWGDERLLNSTPEMVRSISQSKILSLRQQNQLVWESYFSSVDKIINTVIEVVKNRVDRHLMRPSFHWNSVPGAHFVLPEWSDQPSQFPFYYGPLGESPQNKFTAVIYATKPITASAPLFKLIQVVAKSKFCHKVLVLWRCEVPPPPANRWPDKLGLPVRVKVEGVKTLNVRFFPYEEIETDAVFNLDDDVMLTTDEVDFSFGVWKEFPDRLVGYPGRSHFWDEAGSKWRYASHWTNEYSMVLTSGALYHRYYNYLYMNYLSPMLLSRVEELNNCEDILFNFLLAHVTRRSPIKVTGRKQHKESSRNLHGAVEEEAAMEVRQGCLEEFADWFGYMPLLHSSVRMDTMLFKDPVSNMRKQYRQIELVKL